MADSNYKLFDKTTRENNTDDPKSDLAAIKKLSLPPEVLKQRLKNHAQVPPIAVNKKFVFSDETLSQRPRLRR